MNNKTRYGITLKRAKEISKIRIGKLPRCGYSVDVFRQFKMINCRPSNLYPTGKMKVYQTIQLVNHSGKFYLADYISTFDQRMKDYQLGELI